jgi:transcriptional regulator with XRE-family HTH domain
MSTDQINGAAVRAIREARGIERASLAADVGIGRAYLWKIETGVGHPRRPVIRLLARALGVPEAAITQSVADRVAS